MFRSYADYVESIDILLRCDAFPEPTFLWWDVRLQPRFGTLEVRVMDAQTRVADTVALTALVQCLVHVEALEGFASHALVSRPEVLEENRFLASRDGVDAMLILPGIGQRVPVRVLIEEMLPALFSHAHDLGCDSELMGVSELIARPSAARQLEIARRLGRLPGLVDTLAAEFAPAA
jgi:carboxylate-amine ligase